MMDLVETDAVEALNLTLRNYNYGNNVFQNVRDMIMLYHEKHDNILISVSLMEPQCLCANIYAFDPPNAIVFSCGNGKIFHLGRESDLECILKILETRIFSHPSFGNALIAPNIAGLKKGKRLILMKECKCDDIYQRLFPHLYKEDMES